MREKFFKDTKDDIMKKLKNKKIYLYGMPNTWEKLVLDLQIRKFKVEGFILNSIQKEKTGMPSITLDELEEIKDEILVIIPMNDEFHVEEVLRQRGVSSIMKQSQLRLLFAYNPPLFEQILPVIFNGHYQICIYGAGEYGLKCYYLLKDSGINTKIFCDQDERKHGIILDNIECISYEKLQNIATDKNIVIFVCIDNGKKVKEKILYDNFQYVYLQEDIFKMIDLGIMNPYKSYQTLEVAQLHTIAQINEFRRALYDANTQAPTLSDETEFDNFNKALMDILIDARRRRDIEYTAD